MNRSEIIRGFVNEAVNVDVAEQVAETEKPNVKQALQQATDDFDECNIEVDLITTNEIRVDNIYDSRGRMSDAIDAVSHVTGFNVIPLRATDIPKEVEFLQRHLIYKLGSEVYAMSNEIRSEKVDDYCSRITNYIAQGVVFSEKLNSTFKYAGGTYPTLDLTKFEWTMILSKFKGYRSRLFLKGGTDLILEVYPERV